MTPDDAAKLALSLPEATEAPHFEMRSFRVNGKIFATLTPDGSHLHVFVDEHAVRSAIAEAPNACSELWWGKKLSGVRVSLRDADIEQVSALLEESWRRKAPRRLVLESEAACRRGRQAPA
jgi:hypothetical protein